MKTLLNWGYGGLRVASNWDETRTTTTPNASLPSISILPLQQYPGQSNQWLVTPGQRVEEGMVVARGSDGNLHSPIPGLIERIFEITLPGDFITSAAQIRLEGSFTRSSQEKKPKAWGNQSPTELMKCLREAGVLFSPSALGHLVPIRTTGAKKLVVNGLQSEPFFTVPQHLLEFFQKEIQEAILILQKIYAPLEIFLLLNPESEPLLKDPSDIFQVMVSDHHYPVAHEKILYKLLKTSKEETLIVTLETLYWVYDAIVWDRPVTEKFLSFGGHGFNHSGIVKAKIGTPTANLVEDCGGLRETPEVILSGGQFLGKPLKELWSPVEKSTPGFLALTSGEVHKAPESPCIRCGVCSTYCPVALKPVDLFLSLKYNDPSSAISEGIRDCIGCGICSNVCPSRIPLMEIFLDFQKKESTIE